jgi:hypothetical protein
MYFNNFDLLIEKNLKKKLIISYTTIQRHASTIKI